MRPCCDFEKRHVSMAVSSPANKSFTMVHSSARTPGGDTIPTHLPTTGNPRLSSSARRILRSGKATGRGKSEDYDERLHASARRQACWEEPQVVHRWSWKRNGWVEANAQRRSGVSAVSALSPDQEPLAAVAHLMSVVMEVEVSVL
jgi:hypothetical protein